MINNRTSESDDSMAMQTVHDLVGAFAKQAAQLVLQTQRMHVVDDIISEAEYRLVRNGQPMSSWLADTRPLFGIVLFAAKEVRRRYAKESRALVMPEGFDPVAPAPEPSLAISSVWDVLPDTAISPESIQMLLMRYCAEMTYEEIGEIVGVSKQRVWAAIGHACAKLQRDPRLQQIYEEMFES
jgi:DNA-directed RNA polymerase specialized sigma24 family protein